MALKSITASAAEADPADAPLPAIVVEAASEAVDVWPVTWMRIDMPAARWPATVHHAVASASITPTSTTSLRPGCSILVPVVPLIFRSCAIAPELVTISVSIVPGATSIVDGLIANSVSVTETRFGPPAFTVAAPGPLADPVGKKKAATASASARNDTAPTNIQSSPVPSRSFARLLVMVWAM